MTKQEQELANALLNKYVAAIAAGGIGIAAGNAMAGPSLDDLNNGKPSHQHYMTQIGHAQNNAARGWNDLSNIDYTVVEGARQALMGDRMSSAQLDELILSGQITPKQAYILGDVHNFGAHGDAYQDPRYERILEEIKTSGQ